MPDISPTTEVNESGRRESLPARPSDDASNEPCSPTDVIASVRSRDDVSMRLPTSFKVSGLALTSPIRSRFPRIDHQSSPLPHRPYPALTAVGIFHFSIRLSSADIPAATTATGPGSAGYTSVEPMP